MMSTLVSASKTSLEEAQQFLLGHSAGGEKLNDWSGQTKKRFQWRVVVPWLLSIILLLLVFVQEQRYRSATGLCDSYWKPHELEGAKRELPRTIIETRFTGGLYIEPGVGLYREIDPNTPKYVGEPTEEMDAAWEHLIHPLNLFVTLDEAEVMGKERLGIEPASGLYMGMPQGVHDLHCLNMIRQALYLEHYPEMNVTTFQIHIEHCIDSIRQSLMCTSDMTMIPEHWTTHKGPSGGMISDFDNLHICRDYEAMRQWRVDRNAEDDEIWPKVAERLWAAAPDKRN